MNSYRAPPITLDAAVARVRRDCGRRVEPEHYKVPTQ
jgi:hypothetical protein